MIKHSENITNITKALLEFQRIIMPLLKNRIASIGTKSGNSMKYKFATLDSIQLKVNPVLADCGLIVIQSPGEDYSLETMIIHESGEFMSGTYKMVPVGNTPQQFGSVITYQKRYALVAMLNLIVKDDDDGKKGSTRTTEQQIVSKHFKKTSKELETDSNIDGFYQRLYLAEKASLKEEGKFSLKEFLSNFYEPTSTIITKLEDDYFEYKIKNNLL